MSSKYTKYLEELWLDKNEATVYLSLLQFGNAIAGTLIKETKLPRATVYQVLDRLAQKKLVLKIDKWNILTYFPEEPEKLIANLNKETRDLRKKIDLAEKLVPHLNVLKNPHKKNPYASYFEWEEAYYELLEKSLKENEWEILMISNSKYKKQNIKDETKLETIYNYEKQIFSKKRLEAKIKLRFITNEASIWEEFQKQDSEFLRETRILGDDFGETETMIIAGDNLIMITDNYPVIGLHIKEAQFATMMKNLFEFMWKNLG